jgi:MFS family permease
MIKQIFTGFLKPSHYWRSVGFDELSELYVSMLLRSLAMSLVGIFVPVYLYKLGFSVQTIFGFFAMLFGARIFFDIFSAYVVGRIGPKHTMAVSTIIEIFYLLMLVSMETFNWPLPLLALFGSCAISLFFTAYHTDFSKVKHTNHGGKELGFVLLFERLGGIIGPLVGGLLANFYDVRASMLLGVGLLIGSLFPLFLSREPVSVHQVIDFKGFRFKKGAKKAALSYACFAAENNANMIAWTFYVALTIFTVNTYASIGVIIAISTLASLIAARIIGRLIDDKKGYDLLHLGVGMSAILYGLRPFIGTPLQVLGINLINEPTNIAMRMPFLKGFYDTADEATGHRIVYISINEVFGAISRTTFWLTLYGLSIVYDPISVLRWSFYAMSFVCFGILLQNFGALRPPGGAKS